MVSNKKEHFILPTLPQIYQRYSTTNLSTNRGGTQSSNSFHNNHGASQILNSSQNLNSTYQLAMKSKSPSCKQYFGESFTKNKVPISSLSVTKYKQLLAIQDNDPKNPDISLHIPIDSIETQNFIKSLNQQNQNQQQKQIYKNKAKTARAAEQLPDVTPSLFLPFKNSKEINRNQFIKLHQEDPSFQNLDFSDLYGSDMLLMNGKKHMKDQNNLNAFTEEEEQDQSDEDDYDGDYGRNINNSYRKMTKNQKYSSSAQTLNQRPPNKIELSLIHNKDMHDQLNQSSLIESLSCYSSVQQKIQLQQDIINRMPQIRQYPIFKKKQLTSIEQPVQPIHDEGKNEESKEISKVVGSQRQISFKNKKVHINNKANDENDPLNTRFISEEDDKKLKFFNSGSANYQIYWYSFEQNHWKPDIRECQTMIVEGKKAFVFGGVGKELYNSIVELDLETFKWKELKSNQMNGNIPSARFGHSCNLFKKNLIFFGGEYISTQNQVKLKDCLLDVYSYNLETRTWKYITCTGGPLQPRRNHTSAIIGRNLMVHGGVNNKDNSLKDMWFLDLITQTWSEAIISQEFEASFHSCIPVYHSQRCGKINLYKQVELKITKWGAAIQQEGIYFFGGKNTKGEIMGDLKILRTDIKPMQWIKAETKGVPPKARYGHTMDFSQEFNFVILHGGKNDNETEMYFNDIHLLNVDDFNWIKLQINGKVPQARFNHSSCLYETKLVVFGGINLDGYLPPFVNVLELDNVIAGKMKEREEQLNQSLNIANGEKSPTRNGKKILKSAVHNIRFEHIPFQDRLKEIESDLNEQRLLVQQLNFQNFKSYLPVPRFQGQRLSTKRNTILKQNINIDQQTNQLKTPTQSQKTIVYE